MENRNENKSESREPQKFGFEIQLSRADIIGMFMNVIDSLSEEELGQVIDVIREGVSYSPKQLLDMIVPDEWEMEDKEVLLKKLFGGRLVSDKARILGNVCEVLGMF